MVVKEEYKSSYNQDAKKEVRDYLEDEIEDKLRKFITELEESIASAAEVSIQCPSYNVNWCKEDYTDADIMNYETSLYKVTRLIANEMLETLFYYD